MRVGVQRVRERGQFCIHAGASGGVGGYGGGNFSRLGRGFFSRGGRGFAGGLGRIAGGLTRSIQQSDRMGRRSDTGAAASSAGISGSRSRFSRCPRDATAAGTSGSSQPNFLASGFGGGRGFRMAGGRGGVEARRRGA